MPSNTVTIGDHTSLLYEMSVLSTSRGPMRVSYPTRDRMCCYKLEDGHANSRIRRVLHFVHLTCGRLRLKRAGGNDSLDIFTKFLHGRSGDDVADDVKDSSSEIRLECLVV